MTVPRSLCLFAALLLGACQSPPESRPFELVEATIAELHEALRAGQSSCRAIVTGYHGRIETYDKPVGINAITVLNDQALARADEIDTALGAGREMPELFCVPVLVKDNFDTHDLVTTGGSIALINSLPPDDAFMVRKLRAAGAIIIAKTNMAEWAFSPRETVSSSFGRTANAYDTAFVPAGSSGGTASGVAASFGMAGLGSDTGNSIRGPSSHLALFGIRSTIGLTSRDGVIPLIFDRDIAGPMARTVEDGVRLFNVIAGHDPADSLSIANKREPDYRTFLDENGLAGKRIGVFRRLVDQDDADPEILSIFKDALVALQAAGATIVDSIEIDAFDDLSDAIGFCGRFRYDLRVYLESLDEPPFTDVRTVLTTGDYAPESRRSLERFAEAPLNQSPDDWREPCPTWPNHPLRNQLRANAVAAMDAAGIDALVYPTWSNPPAPIDAVAEQHRGDNSQQLVPDAGLPAVTVPMGFWRDRLPVGIQFAGRPFAEGVLIEIAYGYERRTMHRRPPAGLPSLNSK